MTASYMHFESLEEAHRHLMWVLRWNYDHTASPRGKMINEVIGLSFVITDPRRRTIVSPTRDINRGFAVGELCWYLRGDTDLATMLYYNRRMSQFSDDGLTINSAYGARIFNSGAVIDVQPSQWSLCLEELRRDPDSRRAVIHINRPGDLRRAISWGSKDVPCTMSVQFLIRAGRLHMHVLMRSNDVTWGLPYDVFSFTSIMEAFLLELQASGVPVTDLGHYHHTVGSLHLYEQHFEMASRIGREVHPAPPPMGRLSLDGLYWLSEVFEPKLRASVLTGDGSIPDIDAPVVDGFDDSGIQWMVSALVEHREKRLKEKEKDAVVKESDRDRP